ncbi:class I SAM-dependent methyltransferase [Draconibacterium sp. IB214405]|uniref:class I SAM-dependent methyltransferase n=1 Tax=Draconibacterium sp. IB214405 TaxID=3097352 RepID=UPI002A135657|nr:class I SAM-dependent methyltransferase [Draconibacterium sp. IB214405]MDX8338401.1 class I SAM-dependent methyltransferase [Draconibacterium sp. IB214405]
MLETGFIYSTIIDPLLGNLRKRLALEIEKGDTVIDIACGTGAQLFELADTASSVTGIDLSASMIRYATNKAKKENISNASFVVCDATDLSSFYQQKFDVAILSMALHQFDPSLHKVILAEVKKVSKKLVVLDYAVPLPRNYAGAGSKVAEFLAGIEHNRNFKSYNRAGGLNAILPASGFTVERSKLIGKGAFQLTVARNHSE